MSGHPGKLFQLTWPIWIIVLLFSCGKRELPEKPEVILARIGDKTISTDEFIRRAEYTPRPPYCNRDTYIHKKIVLNSLVAEKLMALEAGDDNEFIRAPAVQAHLRGRKEQAMREYQFYREAYDKVRLEDDWVKKIVVNAGNSYRVAYFAVEDTAVAREISREIRAEGSDFAQVFARRFPTVQLPGREIAWSGQEHDAILDSLFLKRREVKNQVIGPIKVDSDQIIFMQIQDWQKQPVVTNEKLQEIWNNVKKRLTDMQARKNYAKYIRSVMRGKTIEFNPQTFYKLAELLAPVYLQSRKQKEEMFERAYWDQDSDEINFADIQSRIKAMGSESFFTIAGTVWTVERFFQELQAHPLVFRKKNMKNSEFGEQFQLAVIDLVRDTYLNQEAYKSGYDKLKLVQRDVGMWQDNFNYLHYKARYLKSLGDSLVFELKFNQVIDRYLNAQVDSLQKKYHADIEINLAEFEKIQLTHIDMSVIQQNVPFAKMVPGFPLVTTDFRLDYGKKMKTDQ